MTKYQILTEVASFAILQGSRAHCDFVVKDTDWDFYCAHTAENKARLSSLGFSLFENKGYKDNNTFAVYRYIKNDLAIDVAIVKDMALKSKMEDWIDEHPWILKTPNYDRPMIYNMVMKSLTN